MTALQLTSDVVEHQFVKDSNVLSEFCVSLRSGLERIRDHGNLCKAFVQSLEVTVAALYRQIVEYDDVLEDYESWAAALQPCGELGTNGEQTVGMPNRKLKSYPARHTMDLFYSGRRQLIGAATYDIHLFPKRYLHRQRLKSLRKFFVEGAPATYITQNTW